MPGDTICMGAGDRRPVLRTKLNLKGDPATNPLTGAVGVAFRMVDTTTGLHRIDDAPATIESVPERIVSYDWGATDTTDPGRYRGFFMVDYGGGIRQRFPSCDTDALDILIE